MMIKPCKEGVESPIGIIPKNIELKYTPLAWMMLHLTNNDIFQLDPLLQRVINGRFVDEQENDVGGWGWEDAVQDYNPPFPSITDLIITSDGNSSTANDVRLHSTSGDILFTNETCASTPVNSGDNQLNYMYFGVDTGT